MTDVLENMEKTTEEFIKQQQQANYTPFGPFGSNCPACLRPYNEKSQIRKDLLTNDEKEVLSKLKKLITEKQQFLDNVREIMGVRF